ncbi:MAG: hypothetical protein ICV77_02065 [Cyanobacteria bacterium Co-bin8]|nr:hypothetical protein [Cyanobacteria bacterium Co-bin8]
MKTQIVADDLVIHIGTLQDAQKLWDKALQLAKGHKLKYITFIPTNGDRPLSASVRRLSRLARQVNLNSAE